MNSIIKYTAVWGLISHQSFKIALKINKVAPCFSNMLQCITPILIRKIAPQKIQIICYARYEYTTGSITHFLNIVGS